jgi:hypothetical protein
MGRSDQQKSQGNLPIGLLGNIDTTMDTLTMNPQIETFARLVQDRRPSHDEPDLAACAVPRDLFTYEHAFF